mgnify:CR=1 FL=1
MDGLDPIINFGPNDTIEWFISCGDNNVIFDTVWSFGNTPALEEYPLGPGYILPFKYTFEELCKTPELICETTMGPIKDFDFKNFHEGACIFTTEVENPEEFGVAEMDIDGKVLSIEEKPTNPKSNDAVVGLYMFDNSVFNKIDTLEPSARGEYEITDLCNIFVSENKCMNLNINGWWIDAGTPERIIELEEKLS